VQRPHLAGGDHLAGLPDGEAKQALLQVCSDLVDRTN